MMIQGVSPAELASIMAVAIFAGWLVWSSGASLVSAALRFSIVAAVAAALAAPVAARPEGRRVVKLIDRSDSVASPLEEDTTDRANIRSPISIHFGDGFASDLAGALDLSGRAAGEAGRIVLYSDGHATGTEPLLKAAELAGRGVQIDVVPVRSRFEDPDDVALYGLDAPNLVRVGDPVSIIAGVRSIGPASGAIVVRVNDREVARRSFEITDFERTHSIEVPPPLSVGVLAIDVEASAPNDPEPDNNRARTLVGVVRPPRVVVIGEGTAVVAAASYLEADGLETTILGPTRVPYRADDLLIYDALVLVDTPASALALDQRAAIEAAVETHGLGLVLSGGRQSFALGGWRGTALERLSPLTMDPAPRSSRQPVTLLLLIDRSASMGGGDGRITKLDLAREAALLAAEALEPQDRIGVVAYDETARWIIEAREVGVGLALAELEDELSKLDAEGGTRILGALDLGLSALAAETGETRHAVLFSDGRDLEEDLEPMRAAAAAAAERGVTLSTIAIGVDADEDFLRQLAQLGRGRFHSALEPSDLPRLLLDEGEIVGGRVERKTNSRVISASPRIDAEFASIDLSALSPIEGHLALEPQPDARRILDTDDGDPLLVAGQRGLGHVVAWSSDMGDDWTSAWSADEAGGRMFGRMVRSVARSPESPFEVRVSPAEGGLFVEIDITELAIETAAIDARLVITDSRGQTSSFDLQPSGIGALGAAVNVPAGDAVAGRIELGEGANGLRWPMMLRRDPNPESMAQRDPSGVLEDIARAGGGRVLDAGAGAETASNGAESRNISLWPFFAAFAAIAWPIDIAIRVRGRAEATADRRSSRKPIGA